jgi:hypothetical protein
MTTAIILNLVFAAIVIAVLARVMTIGYRLPAEPLDTPRSIRPRRPLDESELAA